MRIPGFYKLPLGARQDELQTRHDLTEADAHTLNAGGLSTHDADRLVENAVGIYNLPLGVGLNFLINGREFAVPMAVEEPSVIAAASNAARMVREGGGFTAEADESIMTAQVELLSVPDLALARARIEAERNAILIAADEIVPRLKARGGGMRDLEVRIPPGGNGKSADRRLIVHLYIDCRDAMGANLVNAVAEGIAAQLASIAGGRPGLRILSNLTDRRCVRVRARIPAHALGAEDIDGVEAAREIASASRFAEDDPYRAATHNKGIMNGVDAVVLATGNDWRGVEAGAHAFAARKGIYRPLCTWKFVENDGAWLEGFLEMPMAVGIVGGTLSHHSGARLSLKLIGARSAGELGMVVGATGMASNLAALRVLATEGIQRGHMRCHRRATGIPPAPEKAPG
ncbi:MAG: hydroxymethylglutaryl-CoA reductase, degradative [Deltaproteobacteria bacterium]|nr:hydroxymethylglutaryl-CoA reductase, degradative [Deltaproteobacteria bacterium]